jgi:hypothetical protein
MKKILILGLTAAVMSLSSLTASAGSDAQYPASNFQPKVIYIDKDLVKPVSTSSASTACQCPSQKAEEKATEFDPRYPAANFQPKVIYP